MCSFCRSLANINEINGVCLAFLPIRTEIRQSGIVISGVAGPNVTKFLHTVRRRFAAKSCTIATFLELSNIDCKIDAIVRPLSTVEYTSVASVFYSRPLSD